MAMMDRRLSPEFLRTGMMQSQAQVISEEATMQLVHALMRRREVEQPEPQVCHAEAEAVREPQVNLPGGPSGSTGEPEDGMESIAARLRDGATGLVRAFIAFRATPRQLAMAVLALVLVVEPWFLPTLAVLAATVAAVLYLSLGHDRVAELVVARFDRLQDRNPEAAEQIRARACRISARLTGWLDCLPEPMTRGLYLPDFEAAGPEHEKMAQDPFERLAAELKARDLPGER